MSEPTLAPASEVPAITNETPASQATPTPADNSESSLKFQLDFVETNLRILSGLKPGFKLSIDTSQNFVIDHPSLLQPVYRYLYGDSRKGTVECLENFVEKINSVVMSLSDDAIFSQLSSLPIGSQRMVIFASLLSLMRSASDGLHILKGTYADDETTVGKIQVLLTNLGNIQSHIEKMFPPNLSIPPAPLPAPVISIPPSSIPQFPSLPLASKTDAVTITIEPDHQNSVSSPSSTTATTTTTTTTTCGSEANASTSTSPPETTAAAAEPATPSRTMNAHTQSMFDTQIRRLKSANLQPQLTYASICSMLSKYGLFPETSKDRAALQNLVYDKTKTLTGQSICNALSIKVVGDSI
jgi:hypothetical protein